MFAASAVPFRLTRSCGTFLVLQLSQRRPFQIYNCVLFREVMVGNGKVVVTKIMTQPRPKTRNPSWKLLFSASAVPFRSTRSCQTFLVLQLSQRRTFQIFYGGIFRKVTAGCAKLVVINIMYKHDRKLEIQVGHPCLLLRLFRFVRHAPVEHYLYCNYLKDVRFRYLIELFFGKLRSQLQ